ncbi:DUF898 family protein [uncultured Pelagimonas sp.]|uniref:DUF898 family protein n=1 Tax=uncultured Pelagimonas sp. TaxID=1618102 RepID=UPI00261948B7|nr:DUF898 family protein [uncultured Pelagimonas sp.]
MGLRGNLFSLALVTGLFTVLTLGLYRFWMKTRLRRWYWSAIRIGGVPLEYVGDPIEKLLGFLIAVVILAFYIGIVNLLLMFVSFSFFQDNFAAYLLSFIGVIPIWFYAQYRARRYVLARTRWRGLRFGLDSGAWGYALRALMYWVLTIVSAGLLWPLMTYRLEEYKTTRTSWGTATLEQGGRWTMLYGSAKWLFAGLIIAGAAAVLIYLEFEGKDLGNLFSTNESDNVVITLLATLLAFLVLPFGLVHYRVDSLRRLTETKRMNDVTLTLEPSSGRVFWIYVGGYLAATLALSLFLVAAGIAIAVGVFGSLSISGIETDLIKNIPQWVMIMLSTMIYFGTFLLWSAFMQAFITMPIMRHYSTVLSLHGGDGLAAIRQRPRDEHIEAEGFAEALDVGASI